MTNLINKRTRLVIAVLFISAIGALVWTNRDLALLVLYVDLTLAGYLIAVALLAHAGWDAVHLWRNRVVAASYAEFCGVLDLVLGMTILVML